MIRLRPRRTLNFRFFVVLLGSLLVLGVGVAFLHGYQVQRNASIIKDRAEQAENAGDFEQAARNYRFYRLYVPDDIEAKKGEARCLARKPERRKSRNDWQRELFLVEQVLLREPENREMRRRAMQLTMAMQRTNDAMEHINELLRDSPNDAELERLYAVCLASKGDDVQAEQFFQKAINHNKHDLASYRDLAFLLIRRKAPAEAGKVMDALVKENNNRYESHLLRAEFLRAQGKQDASAQEVAEAVKLEPNNAQVVLAAAQVALAKGKLEEASTHLQRGLERHPANPEMYRQLARVQMQSKRADEAMASLRRGIEAVPEENRNLLRKDLAEILIQRRDPEATRLIAQLRDGLASQSTLDELTAREFMQKGQWLQAIHLLEALRTQAAGRGQGDTLQAYLLLGSCYENIGEPDRALIVYRDALAAYPHSIAAHAGVASALRTLGKEDQALLEYRTIVSEDPPTLLKMAEALILRNQRQNRLDTASWQEVRDLLDQAAKQMPNSPTIPTLRAEALVALGQPDKAMTVLQEARDKQPDQLDLWLALIRATQLTGDNRKTLAMLDEATTKFSDRVELRLERARYWAKHWADKDTASALTKLEQDSQKFGREEPRLLRELADIYYQGGQLQDARRLWDQLLAKDPDNLHIRLMLFDVALQQGDGPATAKSLADLKKAEGADGTIWRYAEACQHLIAAKNEKDNLQTKAEQLKAARELLEQVSTHRPSWGAVRLRRAEIDLLEGNHDAAIREVNQAAELGETSPQVLRDVIEYLFRAQRYQEAQQLLAKVPAASLTGSLGKLSDQLKIHNKDYESAVARARQPVQKGSKDPRDYLWLGQVLASVGNQQYQTEAEQILRQALDLPGVEKLPELWVFFVRFLTVTERKDQAEAILRQMSAKLDPKLLNMATAQCYEISNQLDKAAEKYQAAVKESPNDPAVLNTVASFYFRRGQLAEAEPYLRHLLDADVKASDTERAWARRILALQLANSGDYQQLGQALKLVEENLAKAPTSIEDVRTKATVLSLHRATGLQAARLFEELAKKEPPSLEERLVRARLYERIGETANAVREYAAVGALSQAPAQVIDCGRRLLDLGELDAAKRFLAKVDALDPAGRRKVEPQVAELRALLLNKDGKSAEAAAAVKQLQQAPGVDAAFIASLFEQIGQLEAAEAIYRSLAKQDSPSALRFAAFLGRRGRIPEALHYCEQGWNDSPEMATATAAGLLASTKNASGETGAQVERLVEKSLQKKPDSAILIMCLAALRDKQRNYQDAERLYAQILERDPRNWVALNNLAWLLTMSDSQFGNALNYVQQAIQYAGDLPELLDTRALIYLRLGNHDAAIQDLMAAIKLAPKGTAYFHLALAQQKAGRPKEALISLRKARELKVAQDIHPLEEPIFQQLAEALPEK